MTISNFYTIAFSTNRLKADQSIFEENLTGKGCLIQQDEGEPVELDDGAFYQPYNMWCAITDILIGDQVVVAAGDFAGTYQVKEVRILNTKGSNQHLEILIALPI